MKYYWDRVKEDTSSSGTDDHVLTGAVTDFRSFSTAGVPNGTPVEVLSKLGTQWEVSWGLYNSSTGVVARTRILSSSTGSKITFSGSPVVTLVASAEQLNYMQAYRRDVIIGFTYANDVTDPSNDIVIQPGLCRDRTDEEDIQLLTALTKRLDASWSVGSAAGGLLEGSKQNSQMYAIWALKRTDTAVVDVGFSTALANRTATVTMTIASPGVITWTNHGFRGGEPIVFTTTGALPTGLTPGTVYFVLAASIATDTFRVATSQGGTAINTSGSQSGTHTGTSTPTLPSNYNYARRIGFIRTDSSGNILPFVQDPRMPSRFDLKTPLTDFSTANNTTTAVVNASLCPPNCEAMLHGWMTTLGGSVPSTGWNYAWVRSLDMPDAAASASNFDLLANCILAGSADTPQAVFIPLTKPVRTDHGGRYNTRKANAMDSCPFKIMLNGWYDERLPA